MNEQMVLHLVTWGWCSGVADVLTNQLKLGVVNDAYVRAIASEIADDLHNTLTERGLDPVTILDTLEPFDPLIGAPT